MNGRVIQLSTKPKVPGEPGLPKHSVPALQVRADGVEGDCNNWRTENLPGDRSQAVLVVTRELLDQLRQEGWPVAPGDLGENLTLDDVSEASLKPGVRLAIGEVLLELTGPCDPCTRLYSLPYVGAARGPAFLRATAGRRGWYAAVLQPGHIGVGTQVSVVSPASAEA